MENYELIIFTGVFSGIITSVLIWVFVKIVEKILIPWYQNVIYRGIDLSGDWTSSIIFSGNVQTELIIELSQKGHKVDGTIISKNNIPSKGEDTKIYSFNGEVFDNYIDIEYKINDKKLVGRGSILLRVKGGGEKLEGSLIGIDRFTSEIRSSEKVTWFRS